MLMHIQWYWYAVVVQFGFNANHSLITAWLGFFLMSLPFCFNMNRSRVRFSDRFIVYTKNHNQTVTTNAAGLLVRRSFSLLKESKWFPGIAFYIGNRNLLIDIAHQVSLSLSFSLVMDSLRRNWAPQFHQREMHPSSSWRPQGQVHFDAEWYLLWLSPASSRRAGVEPSYKDLHFPMLIVHSSSHLYHRNNH